MDRIQNEWCGVCSQLVAKKIVVDPGDLAWNGRFIGLLPWQKSYVQEWLDAKAGCDPVLKPIMLWPDQYRRWIANLKIKAVLQKTIRGWILVNNKNKTFNKYTARDFRLVLQLCFDLDLPREFEVVQTVGLRMGQRENWNWACFLLLHHIF
jgi:hypothetical protein